MRAPPLAALLLHALFTGGCGSGSGSGAAVKSPPTTIRGPRCAVFDQLAAATIVVGRRKAFFIRIVALTKKITNKSANK